MIQGYLSWEGSLYKSLTWKQQHFKIEAFVMESWFLRGIVNFKLIQ